MYEAGEYDHARIQHTQHEYVSGLKCKGYLRMNPLRNLPSYMEDYKMVPDVNISFLSDLKLIF